MYNRTKSEKGGLLLMFTALFYLVIGVHALHPHFHQHPDHDTENDHHSCCALHHVNGNHDVIEPENHESCVICGFLAVCQATTLDTVKFSLPVYPKSENRSTYLVYAITTIAFTTTIRGPPQTLS